MNDLIVALNSGSSSVKLGVYRAGDLDAAAPARPVLTAHVSGLGHARPRLVWSHAGATEDRALDAGVTVEDALRDLLRRTAERLDAGRVTAAGHRIVHGGKDFTGPAPLTVQAMAALEALVPLAPQHQPANLAGVRAAMEIWPDAAQVGCFDTAFHRTQPRVAELFALPLSYADEGMIRYGFHGLSYAYIAETLPRVLGDAPRERVVVAHLGHGASMCALKDGKSAATTMGFTALDGLPMARRCGAMDPGLVLYLIEQRGMTAAQVRELLYEQSGLLGLSGLSDDMKMLLASGAPGARLALDYYAYRARREIGSLAAALSGLDALIFTGGVGENAAPVRATICDGLDWLGMKLDPAANAAGGPRISTPGAASAWVIPTNEEWVIARSAFARA